MFTVEGLHYYENYRCWEGRVTVKGSKELFDSDEIELPATINSIDPITEAEFNAITFLKSNFISMYDQLLQGLNERFLKGKSSIEIFNQDTLRFSKVDISSYRDLHQYIGSPRIEIRHDRQKDNVAYIAIYFFNDCLLSIEHGLSALFCQNELLLIDATDTDTIILNNGF